MKIINVTPHPITFQTKGGEVWTEHEPLWNIIKELEYEYRAKRNKEE